MRIVLSQPVADALVAGGPVVALESTIISHGMPYPRNVEMAREVERIVRENGATPATIAVLDGVPRVGLDDAALELLARDPHVDKVSVRDLGHVIATKRHGATTVAATMRLAHLAGIRIFVTGGIGGVHRGGELSLDVSADLVELGRTPVAVISAGVKSILDIGRTLEYLETQGVGVISYRTDEFPSFYSRTSGFASPLRVDDVETLAATLQATWQLGIASGLSIANPVPEADEMPKVEIDALIERAVAECTEKGITGKAITPFLLNRIVELSAGRSLATNIALVKNNARLGARLAVAFARLSA